MKPLTTHNLYEFLDFRLDAENRLLRRGEQIIPLTVKEFEVLLMLVEHAGEVVRKEDLLDKIWKDTFVEEGTLTRNISYLRKKLGAENDSTQFIETLPKRGYRFIPEVIRKADFAAPQIESTSEGILPENAALAHEQPITRRRSSEEQISGSRSDADFDGTHGFHPNPPENIGQPSAAKKKLGFSMWFAAAAAVLSAVIGLTIFYLAVIYQAAPSVILTSRVAPFTGFPGREEMPSFSPDGKQIVFVWNGGESKTMDVYLKMMGEGEPVRLTDKKHDTVYPAFSPDGKRIAFFLSFPDRSEIYTISALGGAQRKVAEVRSGGTSFSWSPDSKAIAVADQLTDDGSKQGTGIFAIDAETGKKQNLTMPPESFRDFSPRFAPDGKSLVFIRAADNSNQDLFIKDIAGDSSAPRRLTFDEAQIVSLALSADGKAVFYNSKRKLSAPNLWRVSTSGGEPELIVTNAKKPTNIAVSPDGKSIAFVETFNEFNVWRYDLDPSQKLLSPPKLLAYIRREQSPQLSPDGSLIAFYSNRTGENEIWLSDAEGKNQRQLTDVRGLAGSPRFSPDGKFLAYDVILNGRRDIFVAPVSSGEPPRNLTENPAHDVLPSWSADGKWVFFCSDRSGAYQIWKIPATGGNAVQLTKQGGIESAPAPNGKTVYYLKENGVDGLRKISVDGSDEVEIPELAEVRYRSSWSITKKGIYFVADSESSPYRIKFYDFFNQQITEIATVEKKPITGFPTLSVSSDGASLIFSEQDQNASSIMIAELPK